MKIQVEVTIKRVIELDVDKRPAPEDLKGLIEQEAKEGHNIFPENGICPVTTKRECLIFLNGVLFANKHQGPRF
jgi:hypothetical protein